ncbi:hypothetical protein [Nostoc sp.]
MPNTSLREAALLYETLRERQGSVTTPTTTLSRSAQCPIPNDKRNSVHF